MNVIRNLVVAVLMTVVTTLMLGVVYPLVDHGRRPGRFSTTRRTVSSSSGTARWSARG